MEGSDVALGNLYRLVDRLPIRQTAFAPRLLGPRGELIVGVADLDQGEPLAASTVNSFVRPAASRR